MQICFNIWVPVTHYPYFNCNRIEKLLQLGHQLNFLFGLLFCRCAYFLKLDWQEMNSVQCGRHFPQGVVSCEVSRRRMEPLAERILSVSFLSCIFYLPFCSTQPNKLSTLLGSYGIHQIMMYILTPLKMIKPFSSKFFLRLN